MSSKPEKCRQLDYQTFEEMIADVQQLQEKGYQSHGNWTLGQACSHVADWMSFPMEGFPKAGFPIGLILWTMKVTVGNGWKKKILAEGFQSGSPTDPKTVPNPNDAEDDQSANKLKEIAVRFQNYDGPLHDSPLFGAMDKETAVKFHLKHASHHFSFLSPKS